MGSYVCVFWTSITWRAHTLWANTARKQQAVNVNKVLSPFALKWSSHICCLWKDSASLWLHLSWCYLNNPRFKRPRACLFYGDSADCYRLTEMCYCSVTLLSGSEFQGRTFKGTPVCEAKGANQVMRNRSAKGHLSQRLLWKHFAL